MFRIKICGITRVEDARAAAATGADAIGLNFYDRSQRCVPLQEAEKIVQALPPEVVKVGVWVNAQSAEIAETFDRLNLDLIQLHGDEPPELCQSLAPRPIMRAFRCGTNLEPARDYLERCRSIGALPRLMLLDSFQPGSYGGTGVTGDWAQLAAGRHLLDSIPLVLAGGLSPHNVAAAIAAVRPSAVDTASGVEESPGRKSRQLIEAFVKAAQEAFANLP